MIIIKSSKKLKMIGDSALDIEEKNSRIEQFLNYLFSFFSFKSKKNLVVLKLSGPIGNIGIKNGLSIDSLRKDIEKAFNMPKLAGVCLLINSPGGSPVQSELIASRIIQLSKEKEVPVYAFVEDIAASGGYFLAISADKIFASKSSIIGSIGVVSRSFGMSEMIKKLGIERRVYAQGKNKSLLDPFMPAKSQDINIIKNLQQHIYKHFVDFVKSRRGGRLNHNDDILFNGDIWTGEKAHELGLIDGIDNMYNFIKDNFGSNVNITYIEKKESWIKKRLGLSYNSQGLIDETLDKIAEKIEFDKFRF